MIKITLATFSKSGGPGRVNKSLASGLRELGVSVEEIYQIDKSLRENFIKAPKQALLAGLDHALVKSKGHDKPISLFRDFVHYGRQIEPPQSLIIGWRNGFLNSKLITKFGEVPTVMRLPDMNAFTGACHYSGPCRAFETDCRKCPAVKDQFQKRVSLNLEEKNKAYASLKRTLFVAPSEWMADLARRSAALSNKEIVVIPNPLEDEFFSSWKIHDRYNEPTITFAASQVEDPIKGFYKVADSLHRLAVEQKFTIRVIGHASLSYIRKYPSFTFLGRIGTKELAAEFAKTWCVFVPSIEETYGNVVAEALASGTPVRAMNSGGIPEILSHVDDRWTFQNHEDLLTSLESIREPPSMEVSEHISSKMVAFSRLQTSKAYLSHLLRLAGEKYDK